MNNFPALTLPPSLEATLKRARRQAADAFSQDVAPFLLQAAASTAAYAAGLAAAQGAGLVLRVSCATPVAGPLGGALGVAAASAAAGQAAAAVERWRRGGDLAGGGSARFPSALPRASDLLAPARDPAALRALLVDAALGLALFKGMGGRFASVMPSDVARVGAIARESLPAAGRDYAEVVTRVELRRMYLRDGCHHCGSRRGRTIADHMPPNKHVADRLAASNRVVAAALRLLPRRAARLGARAAQAAGLQAAPPRQRFYPQCARCCEAQAPAVRGGRRRLVAHEVMHRGGRSAAWHWAGALLGARHAHMAAAEPREGDARRRRR